MENLRVILLVMAVITVCPMYARGSFRSFVQPHGLKTCRGAQRVDETMNQASVKFLHVVMTEGSLTSQMQAIANAAVLAKVLNATLVLPSLRAEEGETEARRLAQFGEIFDEGVFLQVLHDEIHVSRYPEQRWTPGFHAPLRGGSARSKVHLSSKTASRQTAHSLPCPSCLYSSRPTHAPPVPLVCSSNSSPSCVLFGWPASAEELPLQWFAAVAIGVRKQPHMHSVGFQSSLLLRLPTSLAPALQRIRCKVLFHALQPASVPLALAGELTSFMRARQGGLVALHVVVGSGSRGSRVGPSAEGAAAEEETGGGPATETGSAAVGGKGPLDTEAAEVAMLMRALDISNDSSVFLSTSPPSALPLLLSSLRLRPTSPPSLLGALLPRDAAALLPSASASAGSSAAEEWRAALQLSPRAAAAELQRQAVELQVARSSDAFLSWGSSSSSQFLAGLRFYDGAKQESSQLTPIAVTLQPHSEDSQQSPNALNSNHQAQQAAQERHPLPSPPLRPLQLPLEHPASGGAGSDPLMRSLRTLEKSAALRPAAGNQAEGGPDPASESAESPAVRRLRAEVAWQRQQQAERPVADGLRRSFEERPFECLCAA